MALTAAQRQALQAAAQREGVNAAELIAEAERLSGGAPAPESAQPEQKTAGSRPVAERLLVGFLPFIKVRELRAIWLGLPDRIPDDEMTCGEFAVKHGGGAASTSSGDQAE